MVVDVVRDWLVDSFGSDFIVVGRLDACGVCVVDFYVNCVGVDNCALQVSLFGDGVFVWSVGFVDVKVLFSSPLFFDELRGIIVGRLSYA